MKQFTAPPTDTPDSLYQSGPWALDHQYLQASLDDRLSEELTDLDAWLTQTPAESHLRLLTMTRFSNVIRHIYPDAIVVPQGSAATETTLPVSDIDLVIFNVPESPIVVLKTVLKTFFKAEMICQGIVVAKATVPIAKLIERPYGFHIDISMSNFDGALNIPRIQRTIENFPFFRPLLMFLKLFTFAHKADDPSRGGLGSIQLVNLALFALQTFGPDGTLAAALLHMLDLFGHRLNYFLTAISTVDGGRLFSKRSINLLTADCPHALVCENPQIRGRFIGDKTSVSLLFRDSCRNALEVLHNYDYTRETGITAFMPNIDPIIARRAELIKWHQLLVEDPDQFAIEAMNVPKHGLGHPSAERPQHQEPKRTKERDPPTEVKNEPNPGKKKKKNRKKKEQAEKKESRNLYGIWEQLQDELLWNRRDRYTAIQNDAKQRSTTPPRYRR
jgi:hypothetical protein